MAISNLPNPTVFQKTLRSMIFILALQSGISHGNIQMLGKTDGEMLKGTLHLFLNLSLMSWPCMLLIFGYVRDLPDPENRLLVYNQNQISLRYTPIIGKP